MTPPQYWCPKWLREALCAQQTYSPDEITRSAIGDLIDLLDIHRPPRTRREAWRQAHLHLRMRGQDAVSHYRSTTALPRPPLHRVHAVWAMLIWITEPLRCTLRCCPTDEHGRCPTCGRTR